MLRYLLFQLDELLLLEQKVAKAVLVRVGHQGVSVVGGAHLQEKHQERRVRPPAVWIPPAAAAAKGSNNIKEAEVVPP